MSRFPICPLCHGLHRDPPDCLGRPQTGIEWMIDRGVRPERAAEIMRAREAETASSGHVFPPMSQPPDPLTLNVPPYGAPARRPAPPAVPAPVQESLF